MKSYIGGNINSTKANVHSIRLSPHVESNLKTDDINLVKSNNTGNINEENRLDFKRQIGNIHSNKLKTDSASKIDTRNYVSFDTCAEINIVCNRNIFSKIDTTYRDLVYSADLSPIEVKGEGIIDLVVNGKSHQVSAYYTPSIDMNLLGVRGLEENGLYFQSFPDSTLRIGTADNIKNGIKFEKIGNLYFHTQTKYQNDDNCKVCSIHDNSKNASIRK